MMEDLSEEVTTEVTSDEFESIDINKKEEIPEDNPLHTPSFTKDPSKFWGASTDIKATRSEEVLLKEDGLWLDDDNNNNDNSFRSKSEENLTSTPEKQNEEEEEGPPRQTLQER